MVFDDDLGVTSVITIGPDQVAKLPTNTILVVAIDDTDAAAQARTTAMLAVDHDVEIMDDGIDNSLIYLIPPLQHALWFYGTLGLAVGVLAFVLAEADAASRRRREATTMQVLGVSRHQMRNLRLLDAAPGVVVAGVVAGALGWLIAHTYFSIGVGQFDWLLSPLGAGAGMFCVAVIIVVAWAWFGESKQCIDPQSLRRE